LIPLRWLAGWARRWPAALLAMRRQRPPDPWPSVMGRSGTREFVEPRTRRLVAERFGVSMDTLLSSVVLGELVAADVARTGSDLSTEVEETFGVVAAGRVVRDAASYGDLVEVIVELLLTQQGTLRCHQGRSLHAHGGV
jgi:hypothetical protein